MKKVLLSLSVLLSTVCAWGQTEKISLSTNAESPEHVYVMKSGANYFMYSSTGPASSIEKAARFAFFAGSGETDYKILCVDTKKWVSYTPSTANNAKGFATLIDDQAQAQSWKATFVEEGKGDLTQVYQFQPYNAEGAVYASYMNWNGGIGNGYSVDADQTVGVWRDDAATDAGSAWIVVSEAVVVENLKESFTTQENTISVGTKVGQYTVDPDALASAEKELQSATTLAEANAAIAKCKKACVLNTPVVGKYYRIKNTKHKTYSGTGTGENYMNVQNRTENAEDPSQIWLLEQEGEKLYLKNVYTGLYVQSIPSGGDNTATVGISKNYPFTYELHTEAVKDGADASWNIFFGGRLGQVNIESNGNFNYWMADGAHHNIYEIEKTDEELATMCVNWYNKNSVTFTTEVKASDYAKIDVDANATEIISPSEFAAPSEINSTIDKLDAAISLATNALAEVTMENIHSKFEAIGNVSKYVSDLNAYKKAVTDYGALLSIAYTPVAEWGTIILPINWSNPEGWTRYTCAATEGNVLTLTDFAAGATKNTPMIVHFDKSAIGTTYQLIGYSNGAGTENVTTGLLTGVLEDDTNVPAGSYVLSDYNDQIGFYPVATGATYPATKYMCYLTLPAASARYAALFFEGGETAIESIHGAENADAVVYDLAGRRVQGAQKGLFIVNGKKVIK